MHVMPAEPKIEFPRPGSTCKRVTSSEPPGWIGELLYELTAPRLTRISIQGIDRTLFTLTVLRALKHQLQHKSVFILRARCGTSLQAPGMTAKPERACAERTTGQKIVSHTQLVHRNKQGLEKGIRKKGRETDRKRRKKRTGKCREREIENPQPSQSQSDPPKNDHRFRPSSNALPKSIQGQLARARRVLCHAALSCPLAGHPSTTWRRSSPVHVTPDGVDSVVGYIENVIQTKKKKKEENVKIIHMVSCVLPWRRKCPRPLSQAQLSAPCRDPRL